MMTLSNTANSNPHLHKTCLLLNKAAPELEFPPGIFISDIHGVNQVICYVNIETDQHVKHGLNNLSPVQTQSRMANFL